MKNSTILILVFLFFQNLLSAQGTIIGKVFDNEQQAVPFANVLLKTTADSSLTKVEYTNENGLFRFAEIPAATYWINISFIGMEDYTSEAFEVKENQTINLPTINLQVASNDLAEVVVKAAKPIIEVLPDKTVFNVADNLNAVGDNALELLRKSPGVIVDNSETIQLMGNSGVIVYIDGKPSPLGAADLAAFLKGMLANQIESIEIIANPSSKYEAEGNAGIINIRLKKDKSLGFNNNINLGYTQGDFGNYNAASNFNFRNQKLNVFGNYGYAKNHGTGFLNLKRTQNGGIFDQRSTNEYLSHNHNYKIGTDFFINKQHTIGVLLNGSIGNSDGTGYSRTPYYLENNAEIQQVLIAENQNTTARNHWQANVNYQFRDTLGRQLTVDADYGIYTYRRDAFLPNNYFDPSETTVLLNRTFTSNTPTDINITAIKADYEQTAFGGKLGIGAKFSLVNTDNSYQFYNQINQINELDIYRSSDFRFEENINAAYLNYQRKWKKWSLQMGLRAEQTNSTGILMSAKPTDNDRVKRNYLDLFPSGGLTYQLNRQHQLRLTYSRRIQRPKYEDLNPFEFKLDEQSFSRGNPFLRPQYTNSIEIGHTYKYRFTTTLKYSHTKDFFAQISDIVEESATFLSWENLATQKVISLAFSAPYSPTQWWNTYSNVSVFNKKNIAEFSAEKTVNLNQTTASIYSQHTFLLPKDWSLQLSGWWSSPSIWGALYETDALYAINAGFSKKILQGKASIQLSVNDIFRTSNWTATQQFGTLFIDGSGGYDSRRIKVNFSYLLGNDNVKKNRKRKSGLESETGRVN